jgi:hypothetical protein
MNIDWYRAMLRDHLAAEKRARIDHLLAEAIRQLAQAVDPGQLVRPADEAVS